MRIGAWESGLTGWCIGRVVFEAIHAIFRYGQRIEARGYYDDR